MTTESARDVAGMDPEVRQAAVAFIRQWLPERAQAVYRALIAEEPESWRAHPHFAGGLIVEHVLRGNGLTEEALGVADLNEVWHDLLELALREEQPGSAASRRASQD
jgi:hypothetical protein